LPAELAIASGAFSGEIKPGTGLCPPYSKAPCLWRIPIQAAAERGRCSVGASDMNRGVRSEVKGHRFSELV